MASYDGKILCQYREMWKIKWALLKSSMLRFLIRVKNSSFISSVHSCIFLVYFYVPLILLNQFFSFVMFSSPDLSDLSNHLYYILDRVWRFVADKNKPKKRSDVLGEINTEIENMWSSE